MKEDKCYAESVNLDKASTMIVGQTVALDEDGTQLMLLGTGEDSLCPLHAECA